MFVENGTLLDSSEKISIAVSCCESLSGEFSFVAKDDFDELDDFKIGILLTFISSSKENISEELSFINIDVECC
jgi:hypothetical protein